MGGIGYILGRMASDLPAEILIPLMVGILVVLARCYIKGQIPRTLAMHCLLFFCVCGFMMILSSALSWPWAVSVVFILLGVVSLIVMFAAEGVRRLRSDGVIGSSIHASERSNRVLAVLFIVFAVYLAVLTIGLCAWNLFNS